MAVIRSFVLGAMIAGSMMSGAGSNSVMEKKRGQKKDGISWRMGHHSFEKTLNYDNGLGDWLLAQELWHSETESNFCHRCLNDLGCFGTRRL